MAARSSFLFLLFSSIILLLSYYFLNSPLISLLFSLPFLTYFFTYFFLCFHFFILYSYSFPHPYSRCPYGFCISSVCRQAPSSPSRHCLKDCDSFFCQCLSFLSIDPICRHKTGIFSLFWVSYPVFYRLSDLICDTRITNQSFYWDVGASPVDCPSISVIF